MRKLLVLGLFTLAFAIPSFAQSTTPITVGTANCGASGNGRLTLRCANVPVTVGGVQGIVAFNLLQPSGQIGFLSFTAGLEGPSYVQGEITSATVNTTNPLGFVTQATITFTIQGDPNEDGDSDVVVGSITLNFTYTFHGGRGAGWNETITSGSGQQSILQD